MSGGGPAPSRAKHSARSSRAIGIQNRLVRWPVDVPRAVYIRTLVQAFTAWPSNAVRGTLTDRRTEHDGWIGRSRCSGIASAPRLLTDAI